MHSTTSHSRHLLFLAVGAVALTSFGRPNVAHAGWINVGSEAGDQCVSTGVNDNGVVVGYCTPANAGQPKFAWVANNSYVRLPALVSGQPCTAEAVTNSGTIIGHCLDTVDVDTTVTWSLSNPNSIRELGSLNILTSYNQTGVVTGVKTVKSSSQPLIWREGIGVVPIDVEDCWPRDINNSDVNGFPSVAMSCSLKKTSYIAQYNTQYNRFVETQLPSPSGGHCVVTAINDSVQAAGVCLFSDGEKAAFWPNSTSAPTLLSGGGLPAGTHTEGTFLNNNGNVVVQYTDAAGKQQSAFWNTGAGLLYLISPVPGGTRTAVYGLANNDTVILNSEDGGQRVQAAKWTVATGTVPYGDVGGGLQSGVTTISPSGNYAAGTGEDSAGNEDALETSN